MNSATLHGLDAQHPIKNSLAAYDQKYEEGSSHHFIFIGKKEKV